jgi:hypothetical protein
MVNGSHSKSKIRKEKMPIRLNREALLFLLLIAPIAGDILIYHKCANDGSPTGLAVDCHNW